MEWMKNELKQMWYSKHLMKKKWIRIELMWYKHMEMKWKRMKLMCMVQALNGDEVGED